MLARQRCLVAAHAGRGDQRIGRGDLLGQSVDLRGGADGGEASGLVPGRSNQSGGVGGLLMQLGQRRQPGLDFRRERGEIGEASRRGRLGILGRIRELVTSLLGALLVGLGELGALAGALADVLVHAEGEQLDEQALAVGRGRAQELREPALRQQHRLREVLVAEAEQVLNSGLDVVRPLGELLDAGLKDLCKRGVGRDARVEAFEAGRFGGDAAVLVALERADARRSARRTARRSG